VLGSLPRSGRSGMGLKTAGSTTPVHWASFPEGEGPGMKLKTAGPADFLLLGPDLNKLLAAVCASKILKT